MPIFQRPLHDRKRMNKRFVFDSTVLCNARVSFFFFFSIIFFNEKYARDDPRENLEYFLIGREPKAKVVKKKHSITSARARLSRTRNESPWRGKINLMANEFLPSSVLGQLRRG